jgi:hypothetical protein
MSYVPCKHVNAWVDEKGKPVDADEGVGIRTFIGTDADDVPDEAIFWVDRRSENDELLWPDRFPASEVYKLERELGPYAYCTPAESPVLMGDLSMKAIGEIAVGDTVLGFETGNGAKRARMMPSKVISISKSVRPVVRLTLNTGETARCTADHKWFTGRNDATHPPNKAAQVGSSPAFSMVKDRFL